jgi:hypothetical protein
VPRKHALLQLRDTTVIDLNSLKPSDGAADALDCRRPRYSIEEE